MNKEFCDWHETWVLPDKHSADPGANYASWVRRFVAILKRPSVGAKESIQVVGPGIFSEQAQKS